MKKCNGWVVAWRLGICVALATSLGLVSSSSTAAIPTAEKLLPDDTLVLLTVPDFGKLKDIYKSAPQSQFWTDPAMKPFKEKFVAKWQEDFVKPLEHELKV